MPRKCSVCTNPNRQQIDKAMVSRQPYRIVALARHRKHIAAMVAKSIDPEQLAQSGSLLAQLEELRLEAQRLKQKAERAGDYRAALAAVRELCRIVELVAKLCGQLDARTETNIINVNLDPEAAKRIAQTYLVRHAKGELSS